MQTYQGLFGGGSLADILIVLFQCIVVCMDFVLSGTTCDVVTGCQCEPGYLAPSCCECDFTPLSGQRYYQAADGTCQRK